MRRVAPLLALVLLALPAAAWAQRESNVNGDKLLALCTSKDAGVVRSCEAYVSGVSDQISLFEASARGGDPNIKVPMLVCVPAAVTGQQLRETVVGFLQKNTGERSHQAAWQVSRALEAAYPCKGGAVPEIKGSGH